MPQRLAKTALLLAAVLALSACHRGGSNDNTTRVTNAPAPTPTLPTSEAVRYVEAWSSANAASAYSMLAVDPSAPSRVNVVDTVPPIGLNVVLRVNGGRFDGLAATVTNASTRFVVYVKNGRLYKVALDGTSAAVPGPIQLSSETAATILSADGIVAQSATGDDALIRYTAAVTASTTQVRYVKLTMGPTGAPLTLPVAFAGEGTPAVVSWIANDTGGIDGYLLRTTTRLYRTDASFGAPATIYQSPGGSIEFPGAPQKAARFTGGFFFVADDFLRRYDFATGTTDLVFPVRNGTLGGALADAQSFYLLYLSGARASIVKATDTKPSVTNVLTANVATGVPGQPTPPAFWQTADYVLYYAANGALVSARKSDGVTTPLGNVGNWSTPSTVGADGPAGNRVFFNRADATGFRVAGSMLADGSDMIEIPGATFTGIRRLPSVLPAHRVAFTDAGAPFDALLIAVGDIQNAADVKGTLAWIDAATGLTSASVGTLPSQLGALNVQSAGTFSPGWIGTAGAFTVGARSAPLNLAARDAFFLRRTSSSLVRLTTNIQ